MDSSSKSKFKVTRVALGGNDMSTGGRFMCECDVCSVVRVRVL